MAFDPQPLIRIFHDGFPSAYIMYGVQGKGKIVPADAKMLKMGV